MFGWFFVTAALSYLAGCALTWFLVRARMQAILVEAQGRFEALSDRYRSLEESCTQLKAAHASLGQRHLDESNARAAAESRASQVPELQNKLELANLGAVEEAGKLAGVRTELAAGQQALKEQRELLDQSRSALADSFKALSAEALNSNNQAFLQLAKAALDSHQQAARGDMEARQVAVEQMVQPIRDSLSKVDSKLGDMERQRVSAYAALHEQLRGLVETHLPVLHKETANLVKALRQPAVRGR